MTAVRIVDDQGGELPDGEVGEIVARGPLMMSGYLHHPDATADRFRDGWHHTLDLGRREPDGSITFVGPKTALIKSGSENIYPAEVESCLLAHPAIAEVCVIGVPDPVWTQNVTAVVVPVPGKSIDLAAVVDFCRTRMASYKKPKALEIVTALPKRDGIVDRDAVNEKYGGGGYPGERAPELVPAPAHLGAAPRAPTADKEHRRSVWTAGVGS